MAVGTALVCPETRLSLRLLEIREADSLMGGEVRPRRDDGGMYGRTETVLVREDRQRAYPVIDGFAVLLPPEALESDSASGSLSVAASPYASAYEQMAHYDTLSRGQREALGSSGAAKRLVRIRAARSSTFPEPPELWLTSPYEPTAQLAAYRHIAPLLGKRVLQVGGGGTHALAFLLAGASEAWVATPALEELRLARELARELGLASRLRGVLAVGERLPFADGTFDAVYAPGTVHHFATELALPECARVLRPNGKFAAVEPWRTRLYGVGTAVFGKNEPDVACEPLTQSRLGAFEASFASARVERHGALSRYPLILLSRFGIHVAPAHALRIARVDHRLSRAIRPLQALGSAVALLGTRD
jgi:SAM-dependent methyltransferase/uncharacterized protein YbaR (Trm112 family)